MKFRLIHTVIIIIIGMGILKAQSNGEITIGTKHFIKSEILSEEREYWVSLPNSYDVEQSGYKKWVRQECCSRAQEIQYVQSHATKMGTVAKIDNGEHHEETMTW